MCEGADKMLSQTGWVTKRWHPKLGILTKQSYLIVELQTRRDWKRITVQFISFHYKISSHANAIQMITIY